LSRFGSLSLAAICIHLTAGSTPLLPKSWELQQRGNVNGRIFL